MFDETLLKVGNALVDANKSGEIEQLLAAHYSADVVSVEAAQGEGMPRVAEGIDALKGKHAWWESTMEMHSSETEGPFFFAPDRFAVRFAMDATNRETGERMQAAEIGVYTVADGKIVREEFFWSWG